ncbi:MAG TPA: GerMN domain-containing protein [Thermoanaerobacterales bacterium]|nr:GerMN domain-containing protein [Thermoanaerobacterales bacterium]
MNRQVLSVLIAVMLVFAFTISAIGCTNIYPVETPKPEEPVVSPTYQKEHIAVTLYFSDDKGMNVVPEEREVLPIESLEKVIIQELIKGPADPTLKPSLPRGTDIYSIDTMGGIVYVNFTSDIKNKISSASAENVALESVVFSLTELPGVLGVQILIGGKREDTLAGSVNILEPVYRKIKVGEFYNSEDRNKHNQLKAKHGFEEWRFDPLEVAKRDGRMAGFLSTDEFDLVSIEYDKDGDNKVKTALVDAVHKGKSYRITLTQPFGSEYDSIWVIDNVATNFTEIPPVQYENGERYIYGLVKEVDYINKIINIEQTYQNNVDNQVEVGVDIPVIHDAVIRLQKIIGKDEYGSYRRKEVDGEFIDVKPGTEVAIILTKDKSARAVIVTPKE